jgi:YVTN family beta-propeller protein
VSTPGVKRDISTITPIAVFPVEGTPDWQAVTEDAVWVANGPKNTVHRLDAKTNKVIATIEVGKRPCSGLASAFGSIWAPNCTDKTLSRVDMKTNTVVATIPVVLRQAGGLTASTDSIWILSDTKESFRESIETNRVVAEIPVPTGSFVCVTGEWSDLGGEYREQRCGSRRSQDDLIPISRSRPDLSLRQRAAAPSGR